MLSPIRRALGRSAATVLTGVGLLAAATAIAATPTLTAGVASHLSPTGATLTATLADTGGETPTLRGFEFGPTTAYGATTSDSGSTGIGAGKRNWNAVAITPDGSRIAASTGGDGSSSDYLYLSVDGGATWNPLTAAGRRIWSAVDLSADGTKLIAVSNNALLTSTDGGISWTQRSVLGAPHAFRAVAISPNGAILAAADNDGQNYAGTVLGKIYVSIDGGATWVEQTEAGTGYWSQLRFSADSTHLIASAGHFYAAVYHEEANYLWVGETTDSGTSWTWSRQDGAGQRNWLAATFTSADGARMAAVDRSAGLFLSTDGGASWHADPALAPQTWTAVAAAADGSTLLIGSHEGALLTGTTADGGSSWTWTERADTPHLPHWSAAAITSDGGKFLAAASFADFLISPAPVQPIASGTFSNLVAGLSCNSTYHFRAYAINAIGVSTGPDSSFTTSPCPTPLRLPLALPATNDLGQDMINGIDQRLATFTAGAPGTRNLWSARGNGSGDWQGSAPTFWAQRGARPLDFSGASPWNSDIQFKGAGTLISPRHLVLARHFTPHVGSTFAFVDANHEIFTRKLVGTRSIGSTDITIGVLDTDLPSSVTYYPLLSSADFRKYVAKTGIPLIRLDQLDAVHIQQIASVSDIVISTAAATGVRAPYTVQALIGGDSGNPNFVVVGDELVLLGAHFGANNFPALGGYLAEINAAMEALGGGYQITQLDLSHYTAYGAPQIPLQAMSVVERSPAASVVGTVQVQGGSSALHDFRIAGGDPDGAFAINASTGVITVARADLLDYRLVQSIALSVAADTGGYQPGTVTGTVNVSIAANPALPHPPVSVPGKLVWTAHLAAGARAWSNVVGSGDGRHLAATDATPGAIWTSVDAGATWIEQTAPGTARTWWAAGMSADGSRLLVGDYGGSLWLGSLGGAGTSWSWTESSAPARSWSGAIVSADGSRMLATAEDGGIFVSSDAGASWTDRSQPGMWNAVAASANASRVILSGYDTSTWTPAILVSDDFGLSWANRTPAPDLAWSSVASSADGGVLAAASSGGSIYTSTDGGLNWQVRSAAGIRYWSDLALSADASSIAAASSDSYVFSSPDGGASWLAQTGSGPRAWSAIALSGDGGRLAAVGYGENLWTATRLASLTTGDPSALQSSSALLHATIDDLGAGSVTMRGFEYGPTMNYGASVSQTGDFSSGDYSAAITGLSCGVTMHLRAFASNSAGTTHGADRSFAVPCPVTLSYNAGPHGSLVGSIFQTVEVDQSGTAVIAVADAGYHFSAWSDGATDNPRTDIGTTTAFTVTALFASDGSPPPPPPGSCGDGCTADSADVPLPGWALLLLAAALATGRRRAR